MLDYEAAINVHELHGKGYSYSEIADETGCTFSEIRKALIMTKEEINNMNRGKIPDEIRQQAVELHEIGLSNVKIAEKLGIGDSSVSRIVKEKEPPAAAAVESSEENVSANISENIIPETEENVKTPHLDFFNGAEEEAVIGAVSDKLKEYTRKISELTKSIEVCRRECDMLRRLLVRNGYKDVLQLIDKEE